MKIKTDLRLDSSTEQDNGEPYSGGHSLALSRGPTDANGDSPEPSTNPVDLWTVIGAVKQRWWWLLLAAGVGATLALGAGRKVWKSTYTATVELVRYDSPNARELSGDHQIASATFASLLRSPEILRRVSERAQPPVTPAGLAKRVRIITDRDTDVLTIEMVDSDGRGSVDLANLYAEEAVRFTKTMQAQAAAEAGQLVTQHLARVEAEISTVNQRVNRLPTPAMVDHAVVSRLQLAREELNELLERYTDLHPLVQGQRAKVAAMEKSGAATTAATDQPDRSGSAPPGVSPAERTFEGADRFGAQLQTLETARLGFSERQRTLQLLQVNPPGYYQVLKPATAQDLIKRGRKLKVMLLGVFGGLIGLFAGGALALGAEALDSRLKNPVDVSRVTGLPVLAAAGDLYRMQEVERRNWAFRAWTNLQWHLTPSPNQSLICGFTADDQAQGRFPWVTLMGEAASQRGFRVLTIETCSASQASHTYNKSVQDGQSSSVGLISERTSTLPSVVLDSRVLAAPEEITSHLTGPEQQAVLRLPLPGWVWNLQRRNQWRAAMQHWSRLGNVVILVDLPAAPVPEALLLAESLPNIVWVSDGLTSDAAATRRQVHSMRQARCHMAGVMMNHAPASRLQDRFARWVACCLCLSAMAGHGLTLNAGEQQAPAPAAEAQTNASPPKPAPATEQAKPENAGVFSGLALSKRASWQEQLTLGPGDLLNFSLFGVPESTRVEIPIAPDGSVSFLEAQNVPATGLTIDQLRSRFDEELGKYRRAPRTMIWPSAFRSKKYFVLGRVAQRGAFVLDRPMTIIEAVAHAQGLETAQVEHNTMELADFSRSFLVRRGQRVPVDFEKLFQQGDLSQNVPLEPDDYLFFPAGPMREIYVLGEVRTPGVVAFRPGLAAVGAIAARGGFTERAWRQKILVVRGSLSKPEAFPVNTAAIVTAREPDFKLQPRDIIYVSARPWIKAEEVLDATASAFIEAVVITWTGKALF